MSCGQRTLVETVDAIAAESPDRTWAWYPDSAEAFERGELRSVTFAAFANAINRLSWHLKEQIPAQDGIQTVAYIGPSDLRYFVLACAASKCGLKALFSSPRNNLESHLSLLESTECQILLQPREKTQDPTTQSILAKREMRNVEMPTLSDILDDQTAQAYPTEQKLWTETSQQPFLTLHTSGSTGLPKPIDLTHGLVATIDAQQLLPDVDGRHVSAREWANRTVYTALPPFHAAGVNFFGYSIFQATQLVLGPSDKPPSVSTVETVLNKELASAGVMAPSLLAEVAAEDALLEKMARWKSVTFGGGPLDENAGDRLWEKTKVLQIMGSTETFNIPELTPRAVDEWAYHCYHPALGIEFQDREQGLCELVFKRRQDTARHQGAFWTFPELEEYPMKDLYEQHSSKPGLWTNRGRLDDIIVLSNGEKLNPSGAERVISQDPNVKGALIVGNAHTQPALLIESTSEARKEPRERRRASIMGAVRLANEALPGHAQIHDLHICLLEESEEFLRSSKGEVRRLPTTDALKNTIDNLYNAAESLSSGPSELDFSSEEALQNSLLTVLSADFLDGRHLQTEQNIFDCGFDSLRAVKLLRCIKSALKDQQLSPSANLTPRLIYQNHSAAALAKKIWQLCKSECGEPDDAVSAHSDMQRLLDSCTARIDEMGQSGGQRNVVVLTGSTGSLGSYILDNLISHPHVSKVICLNRQGSDEARQVNINESRGLSTALSTVSFLEADLTQDQLGLAPVEYHSLLSEATHIIHNAWPVNFNLALSAFEPQLEACHCLIELANTSVNRPEITFISSVGAANDWTKISDAPVPETLISDFRAPEQMGYGQSKQLAELQFAHAGKALGLPMTICRIGQVAGPVKSDEGTWSINEWFPSLIASCKTLGKVPDSLGAMSCMDWIPVDCLSEMLVQTVMHEQAPVDLLALQGTVPGSFPRESAEEMHPTRSSSQSTIAMPGVSRDASPSAVPSSRTSVSSSSDQDVEAKAIDTRFLHFVNPQKARWQDVVQDVAPMMDKNLKVVPYSEWLEALTAVTEQGDSTSDLSASKLLEFYREIGVEGARRPLFVCDAAQSASSKLRELPAVSTEWFGRWIRQWRSADQTS